MFRARFHLPLIQTATKYKHFPGFAYSRAKRRPATSVFTCSGPDRRLPRRSIKVQRQCFTIRAGHFIVELEQTCWRRLLVHGTRQDSLTARNTS